MAIYESYTPYSSTNYDPHAPIVLRKEQRDAVNKAKEHFKKGKGKKKFLWNAKMRFGKTISALTLAKELNVKLTLIVTHRPVVDANFREDFDKVFKDMSNWHYASRFDNDETGNFEELKKLMEENDDQHLVFFASMQYLRRSAEVNTKPGADHDPVKKEILETDWNLVVVDEAHEGTTTSLGKRVIEKLTKDKTWMLHLSGTPFNLYTDFTDNEIFTWDYIQEQQAKKNWNSALGENPYITLPTMKIFTYDLAKLRNGLKVPEGATFTLGEFFRTWTGNRKTDKADTPEGKLGKFVHEEAVKNFLQLLYSTDEGNNYPFSKEEYQENFLHTLWVVPGVKEAKALAELLRKDEVFGDFEVINVAGDGDEDEQREDALDLVLKKIGKAPTQTRTITLSCGRLTTGVTVPPWTAVFYLKGSDNTSAATYMQTIFRVQGSHVYNGKMKSECYVFDFAPDRSLHAVAETAKFYNLTQKEKTSASFKSKESDLNKLKEFISFCPVISLDGGAFVQFDEHKIFEKIHSVYIDRIVQSGFTDNALFNKDAIMSFNDVDLRILDSVDEKKPKRKPSNVTLNNQGMIGNEGDNEDDEEDDGKEDNKGETSGRAPLSEEEKQRRREQRTELENRRAKLRDITVRIPLLIFGGKFNDEEEITLDNFTRKVDDASWEEFMPKKLTKQMFNKLKAGINANRFVEAGKRILYLTREADNLHIEERIARITQIHEWFNNPNKETVLTPWRVVNMHLSDTLGGYSFYNETFDGPNQKEIKIERKDSEGNLIIEYDYIDTLQPRFVKQGKVTEEVFGADSERPVLNLTKEKRKDAIFAKEGVLKPADEMDIKILEINSKTGLYPLYATYSLYRNRLQDYVDAGLIYDPANLSIEEEQVVWDDVLQNNIYVISNTKMAEAITRRTLYGFREVERTHIKHQPIIERAKTDQEGLAKELKSESFWNGTTSHKMLQFSAIIGNPPYQENVGTERDNYAVPIYHLFFEVSKKLKPNYISMIIPSRWFSGGRGLDEFRETMLNDNRIKCLHDYPDSTDLFPTVDISAGICYLLWKKSYFNDCHIFVHNKFRVSKAFRPLKEEGMDSYIRHNEGVSIWKKVKAKNKSGWFNQIISPQTPFGLLSSFRDFKEEEFENSFKFYTFGHVGFVSQNMITRNKELAYRHKVYISKAYGERGKYPFFFLGKPFYGEPNSCCSQSYLVVGPFSNKETSLNVIKYMKSKFFRAMVMLKKNAQDNMAYVFSCVPQQDFSISNDIDWSKNIKEIDQQLYVKYKLNLDEIDFIESMIKPMD